MAPETVETVLAAIADSWPLSADIEITLEANPTSVEAGRFAAYRGLGVNRVSLGVQALNDNDLKALGRLHTVAEARAAIDTAHRHFDRVSFDLIYARMGQSSAEWSAELRQALALAAGHLSLYQLTIEPNTPFFERHKRGQIVIPGDETAAALYDITQDLCAAAGLSAYEISNHARPGDESRHNLVYWRMGDYVGVGPGAHGRVQIAGERHATVRISQPERWAEAVESRGHGTADETVIDRLDAADEMLLMGLRLAEGIDPARYRAIGGEPLRGDAITQLAELGLLAFDGKRLRATPAGRPVLNRLVAALSADR